MTSRSLAHEIVRRFGGSHGHAGPLSIFRCEASILDGQPEVVADAGESDPFPSFDPIRARCSTFIVAWHA